MQLSHPVTDRRDLLAVAVLFAANGFAVGAFGGSIPALRERFGLSAGEIAALLIVAGVSAIVGMNVTGRLADNIGARTPTLVAAALLATGTVAIGWAPSFALVLMMVVLWGLGNGAMDVGMNSLGVQVERRGSRSVMSRLHAFFSLGNFAGAILVVGLGALALPGDLTRWTYSLGGLISAALVAAVAGLVPGGDSAAEESGGRGPIPPLAWLLAAMALCFGLTEGTGIDWSSLHVVDVVGVSADQGAWGLAAVSGFMVVIRLLGDGIVERFGRGVVVRAGSATALVGYLMTAFTSSMPSVLLGWSLVGLGVGLIAPQIYGMAGHIGGGRGLAMVVTFGYTAFLLGPAIIGYVADHSDLQRAMLVPVVSAVGLIVMSTRLPRDLPERT